MKMSQASKQASDKKALYKIAYNNNVKKFFHCI